MKMVNKSNVGKSSLLLKTATLATTVLLLAGCNNAPSNPPNEILREAMKKSTMVLSHTYEVNAKGDFSNGVDNKKLSFNGNVLGGIDFKDAADPKFTMKLVGSGEADAVKSDAAFDMRFDKAAVYLNLSSFNLGGMDPAAKAMLDGFKNKWWKVALPAEALQALSTSIPSGDDSKLTPEQKQIRELMLKTDFFDNVVYVDTQDVKGENSYHLKGTLNKTNVKTFLTEVAKIQGQTDEVQAEMLKDMDLSLTKIGLDAEIWVGKDSGFVTKMFGHLTVNDPDTKIAGQADFTVTMADFNKPYVVEVPKDAVDFPIDSFLPGFGGAPQTGIEPEITTEPLIIK